MPKKDKPWVNTKPDKTVVRALGLGGLLGGSDPACVDVKDGKIIRIRPLHFDWKFDRKSFNPWKFERNGHVLESNFKGMPAPWSLSYKKRTYSPNRIKYPLQRVDWDPQGERNTENRGKSKYVRISWEEATNIISAEIKRIIKTYGPLAILAQGDGHGECKTINTPHGHQARLLEMLGGFTQQVRNPDSWEGFYWGSKHVWGQGMVGMMDPSDNCVKDIIENCELVLFWGCDPETTPWGFVGQFASRLCYFWTKCGIKQVYICPDLNYGAAVHADKWIPVLPNTDAALQLAIIYLWLKEGTYNKEYVRTHTIGMDKVEAYVMGEEDGVPKTPDWASKKSGVPPWTIKALARDLQKEVFNNMGLEKLITWEDFVEKQYVVLPTAEDWEQDIVALRPFHDDPEKNPLPTPSGKLEFYSERIARNYPDDQERPPIPKWVEKSAMHDERRSSMRANAYPLLLMSNHGRWRVHSQADDISWSREIATGKVKGWDGYMYEPLWIHPTEAEKRGIKMGDIVQVYNERGIVLCGARVWERVMPGVVYVDHGARHDPIIPGKVDRGGANQHHLRRWHYLETLCWPGDKRVSGGGRSRHRGNDGCLEEG